MAKLAGYVHVYRGGETVIFGPDDEVPDWAAKQITNPKAWEGDPPAGAPDRDGEPPRSGKGSGEDAWREYAEGLGIDVPADASRDDIIALVDAR